MSTPEQLARINIDKQLEACGWIIQSRRDMNLFAAHGVAVREFPLDTGEADYLLFVGRKAVGVVAETISPVGGRPAGRPPHRRCGSFFNHNSLQRTS